MSAYRYDERAAEAAVAFFPRYLRLTEGEWAGRPFVLADWQANDIVRPFFGWKRADGTRRYRRAIVWVPRKNGKTELAAGVGLLALIADGEMGGQVYSIATDKDQAKLVFGKAAAMVNMSAELAKHLECFKPSIYCAQLQASFKPLSGTPSGKHGLSPSGIIGDEVHEWANDELYTFVHQGTAARRQPIEFLISTAGKKDGYGWELWDYCQKVLAGDATDDETLIVIYAADPEADWTDEATWRQANPNLGISPKLDYLRAECAKAREMPRLENDFKRYHLNIWTEQDVRWMPIETWDACAGEHDWRELERMMEGRACFAGNDLSTTTDLTAKVLAFPPDEDFPKWVLLTRFYVPGDRITERVRRDKVPYDIWLRDGAITATPGNVIDYDYLKEQTFADAERFHLLGDGYDPFNATQVMIQVGAEGVPVMKVRQGYLTLSPAMKEFERLILAGDIVHGGHPVLRWCMKNVAVESDAAGNIKPSKAKSTERIDGAAAAISAIALATSAEDTGPSVYESRGIMEIEV